MPNTCDPSNKHPKPIVYTNAHDTILSIQSLFSNGLPPFELFPKLPVPPTVVAAKLSSELPGIVDAGIDSMKNERKLNNARTEYELKRLQREEDKLDQHGGTIRFSQEECTFF